MPASSLNLQDMGGGVQLLLMGIQGPHNPKESLVSA